MTSFRRRITERSGRINRRLNSIPLFVFVKRVAEEWNQDEANDRAGAVAYHAFLSLFPLLLGMIAFMGFILPDMDVRAAVSDALVRTFPGSVEFIEGTLDAAIELRGVSGVIGVVGLLWSGSNAFAAIRRAINRAWGIRKERRFIVGKSRDLAMVFGAGSLFLLSTASISATNFIGETGSPVLEMVVGVGSQVVAFLLAFLVFIIIYKWVPNTQTYWRWTWPGALLASFLYQAGTNIFIVYVANFADFQSVYGPLASVIALLLWIYISSMILILGVEVTSEMHRMRLAEASPDKRKTSQGDTK